MPMTRDEFAERLGEMKREDWPRLSVAHILPGDSPPGRAFLAAAADPTAREIIDAYLSHYVPGDCPCCGHGSFGWGNLHGAGSCSCGWPGRVLHHVTDDREEGHLLCGARCNGHDVCGARRDEHVPTNLRWASETESGARVELRCPSPKAPPGLNPADFTSTYRAPEIVFFQALLWSHPYEVTLRP